MYIICLKLNTVDLTEEVVVKDEGDCTAGYCLSLPGKTPYPSTSNVRKRGNEDGAIRDFID